MSFGTPNLTVDLLGEATERVDLEDVVQTIAGAPRVQPFDGDRVAFLADFARRLSKRARGHGDMQSLAFWLRRSELSRMEESFRTLADDRSVLVPRGVAFHIPPANVGTIFVYSLALALLAGNNNIVRMSSRGLQGSALTLAVLRDTIGEIGRASCRERVLWYV